MLANTIRTYNVQKDQTKMKMKVTEKPVYPEIEIVGKTYTSLTGSIDRKKIGRCLLTEEVVEKTYNVVGGDDTVVKSVKKIESPIEMFVEFVGGVKSLASFKAFDGYYATNAENQDVKDVFVQDDALLKRVTQCACRMCEAHPECDDQWKITDANGGRIFLRLFSKSITKYGTIVDRDGDEDEDND